MGKRAIKVTLDEKSSDSLREVAQDLGISETDVIRKGLTIMGLYAKMKKDDSGTLLIEQGDKQRELLLV